MILQFADAIIFLIYKRLFFAVWLYKDFRISTGRDCYILFSHFQFLRIESELFDPLAFSYPDSLSSGPYWLERVSIPEGGTGVELGLCL